MPALSAPAHEFVESVLALKPRVAVFDCDGTLWSGDAGADFFYWEIERGIIPGKIAEWALPRYEDYKAGKVDEETMCGEMVTINAGVPERLLADAARDFFASVVEKRIFPEMQRLTQTLATTGCQMWAVSSTCSWVVRTGVKRFGIPAENVLGASVHIEGGIATNRLIRVPTDEGKASVLRETLRGPVETCFGNSIHDAAMLEIAQSAFAVNPTADLEKMARNKNWKIYWPAGTRILI
jgi:phosphoserine phosphatase